MKGRNIISPLISSKHDAVRAWLFNVKVMLSPVSLPIFIGHPVYKSVFDYTLEGELSIEYLRQVDHSTV